MPPKKRTNQSKHTPPTSPTTSTSHTSADHHHHLRHTGPSITRAGVAATPSKPPPAQPKHTPGDAATSEESETKEKPPAKVPAPGGRTSFIRLMYYFVAVSVAPFLLAWFAHEMAELLGKVNEGVFVAEQGGTARWEALKSWRFGADRVVWSGWLGTSRRDDLEGSLNALADALGISPVQVASAVKSLIPEATLSSIASKATGRSEAVRILYEDTTRDDGDKTYFSSVMGGFSERMEKGPDEEETAEGIA